MGNDVTQPTHEEMVGAFLREWEAAGPEAHRDGAVWYTGIRGTVRQMARETGVRPRVAAGVVSALSPRQQWVHVLRSAPVFLRGGLPAGFTRRNVAAALRMREGEPPLEVLVGRKVRAFYRALVGDDRAAVVDSWVTRASGWPEVGWLTPLQYDCIAAALRDAAGRVGVAVAPFQATVWVSVRGRP